MKFFSEYTRAVLSEVAVATSGRPLGFGIETQARDDEIGLKSARGRIRTCVEDAIVAVCVSVCCRTQVEEKERQTSRPRPEIAVSRRGRFVF